MAGAGAAHPIAVADYTFTDRARIQAGTLPTAVQLADVVDIAITATEDD